MDPSLRPLTSRHELAKSMWGGCILSHLGIWSTTSTTKAGRKDGKKAGRYGRRGNFIGLNRAERQKRSSCGVDSLPVALGQDSPDILGNLSGTSQISPYFWRIRSERVHLEAGA